MSQSFDEYYMRFQQEFKLHGKSGSTAKSYQRLLRRFNERIPKDQEKSNELINELMSKLGGLL